MKTVEAGGDLDVLCGETFRVLRRERPGGYLTEVRPPEGLRHEGSRPVPPENPGLIGGGGAVEEEFVALEPGERALVFRVARPWEPDGGEEVVTTIRIGS